MSICASGFSTTKPGAPASMVIDDAYVQSILPAGLAWAVPYLPFMGGLVIDNVGAFCAADPPSWTVPTGEQILNFITGGLYSDYIIVRDFLNSITRAFLWYNVCQCTTGTTPAAPAAPAAPVNLPSLNPPAYVSTGPAAACGVLQSAAIALAGGGIKNFYGSNSPLQYIAYPVGTTLIRVTATMISGAGLHDQGSCIVQTGVIATATGVNTAANSNIPIGGSAVIDLAVASPATGFRVQGSQAHVQTTTDSMSVKVEFYCGGATPGAPTAAGSCSPDPFMRAALEQLLDLVTLIQRQHVPFAYLEATAHPGLTVNGSFSVQGRIGFRVQLTTLPSHYGLEPGVPDAIFDAGFVTFGDDSGYLRSERIDQVSRLYFPPTAGSITKVGYSLSPGVVARITELRREP